MNFASFKCSLFTSKEPSRSMSEVYLICRLFGLDSMKLKLLDWMIVLDTSLNIAEVESLVCRITIINLPQRWHCLMLLCMLFLSRLHSWYQNDEPVPHVTLVQGCMLTPKFNSRYCSAVLSTLMLAGCFRLDGVRIGDDSEMILAGVIVVYPWTVLHMSRLCWEDCDDWFSLLNVASLSLPAVVIFLCKPIALPSDLC